jgi:membrane-associated protease RseP (regulator of RpoE activity)
LVSLGVLAFAAGLLFSIALHELGHLSFAKAFRVKTTQYMVGFGPTLWSRRRGETEYGIKAIPLGGYIRMVGMFPPAQGEDAHHLRRVSTSPWGAMVEDTRAAMYEEVKDEEQDRVFYRKPWWQKVLIMLAGPFMNLLIAAVCFTALLTGFGVPTYTPLVRSVSECAPIDSAQREADAARAVAGIADSAAAQREFDRLTACRAADPVSPAARAGVLPGDRIVAFAGTPVQAWEQVQGLIRERGAGPVDLVVERAGERISLTADLVERERPVLTDAGDAGGADGADGAVATETVSFLGVGPTQERVTLPVTAVPGELAGFIGQVGKAVVAIPSKVPGLVSAIGGAERDVNGPQGIVGVGRLSAEVAVAPRPVADRVAFLISILASLNMSLFLFNLVPLLPLDGGHVAGALYEQARRVTARLLRRPDPGFFDTAKLMPAAYVFASVLIVFTVLVFVADVVNPIRLAI